jgi:5-methylcytosine-specific restriction endonuclease McrA
MGKRPAITPAMRLNVLKQFGAVVLCQICGDPEYVAVIQIDHELALIDEGAHCTDTNLRPVCIPCHAKKSAREHKNNAKAKRLLKKHSNPKPEGKIKSRPFQGSRKFDGTPVWRSSK